MTALAATVFRRDRLTWLMYVMLAGLAYQQGILGPLMPFLRDELHMSYTLGGVLFTAIAIGMIFSGLISDRVARRFGRRAMFWMGGAGYVVGSVAIALSPSFPFAFAAILLNSVFTSFSITAVNATLSDHHGAARAAVARRARPGVVRPRRGRTGRDRVPGGFQLPRPAGAGSPDAHARPDPDRSLELRVVAHGWSAPGRALAASRHGTVAVCVRAKSAPPDRREPLRPW